MRQDDLVLTSRGLRFQGVTIPCVIGRNGLTSAKREGDSATPRGEMQIVACLFRPDRMLAPNAWSRPINLGELWSDDPNAPDYNHLVRAPYRFSHENMRRADPLYDLVLVTDWNWSSATPGRGSAIFIHRWRKPGHPTEGCIALNPLHLCWIASKIIPGTRLIVR